MKVNKKFLVSILLIIAIIQIALANPAYAAGVVSSCTEAGLDAALAGGGAVSFNCTSSPITILLTSTKVISSNTQINGGGLITLSGDANNNGIADAGDVRLFTVDPSVTLDLSNLTLSNGFVSGGNGGAILINSG